MRIAQLRIVPLRIAPLRFDHQSCPAEVRLDEVRLARPVEVRQEQGRVAEDRPAEVRPAEFRVAEVRLGQALFPPPGVPIIDALPEKFEMLFVGHWVHRSRCRSTCAGPNRRFPSTRMRLGKILVKRRCFPMPSM